MANAVEEGRSWFSFVRDVARHRLADAKVGSQYATPDFAMQVTAVGAMVMAQMDAHDFADDLPGLGIPSDFAVLADPVSIGASMKSRHGDLLVMCLAIVSARAGGVYFPMHSAEVVGISG